MFGLFKKWKLVEVTVWIAEYKNDKTFKKRYDKAWSIINNYEIVKSKIAVKVFTDLGIECGIVNCCFPSKHKKVKQYLKIPFQDYVRK